MLSVLDEAVRSPDVGWIGEQVLLLVHLDPLAAHRLVPNLFVVHRPTRKKDETPERRDGDNKSYPG